VPGENSDVVYNTPNPLMSVFPGEDYGLHSDSIGSLKYSYRRYKIIEYLILYCPRHMLHIERFSMA
jgi:hypothetical protein